MKLEFEQIGYEIARQITDACTKKCNLYDVQTCVDRIAMIVSKKFEEVFNYRIKQLESKIKELETAEGAAWEVANTAALENY